MAASATPAAGSPGSPGSPTSTAGTSSNRDRLPTGTLVAAGILLLIPCAALAAVPLYSRRTPILLGWPFFYWFQVLWVLITPVLTFTAYLLIKRARGQR